MVLNGKGNNSIGVNHGNQKISRNMRLDTWAFVVSAFT